jgi:heavy metal translocating P-type ATPase
VDGVIISGNASIDQHVLTGESQPAEKGMGDQVFAATIILSGRLHVRVENAGHETVVAKIVRILNKTDDFKSFVQLQGEQIADKSVLPTLAASAFAYPFVGAYGTIALLSSNFLDNMRIVAPIGMLNILRVASQGGLLIKDGRSLELLNQVDTFIFDKTGTLTLEQPYIRSVFSFSDIKEDRILAYAAMAESRQNHPIAKAILEEARKLETDLPEPDEASYKIGYGITVKSEGRIIRAGSARFMEMEGISIPAKASEIANKSYDRGYSLVYVAVDNTLAGAIELEPTIRPEAEQLIADLKERDMSVHIISGDHEEPTRALAQKLGIDHFFAEVLPKNKADLIEELRKQGRKVCFVGDGINDSIALKKAHVSISLRGASTVATDTAQIVLMDGTLKKIPVLLNLAHDFQKNMRDSFYVVCAPAVFGIGGIFFLHFGLLSAVLMYNVSLAAGAGHAMLPWIKREIKDRRTKQHGKE